MEGVGACPRPSWAGNFHISLLLFLVTEDKPWRYTQKEPRSARL